MGGRRHAAATRGPQLTEREFHLFRDMLLDVAGIELSDAKRALVAGRLGGRLREHGWDSYGAYFHHLRHDHAERQAVVDLLTTNETYFFREPRHFEFLRDTIVPGPRAPGPLRAWSAACSSGQEPYSIAMTLAQALAGQPWEVLASDLSTRMLARARAGIYRAADVEGIPRALLHKYCLRGVGQHEGQSQVDPALRERVSFRQINLNARLPALGAFDVIFLRNVLIYFGHETKCAVVRRLQAQLRPGGWLIVGHAETLNRVNSGLTLVQPSIYRKPDA
ncbi:chemotaxis protein methyltransferase CheR [Duganella sp. SG902]|uniref:CheR family methyltransferase n=1 Tax=Duganella sp. SG902 TaxID=2587016 RepID=UPI00159D3B7E|nr:protein-glutamate O-methyltransferase CheR [Duganella sp. SG902]NVM75827.1 chemotaxis protein methyltransferase CheR [Duganella sp. SG902]